MNISFLFRIVTTIIIVIITTIGSFRHLSNSLYPSILNVGLSEAKKMTTRIINDAMIESLENKKDDYEFYIEKNSTFNTYEINLFIANATKKIYDKLIEAEKEGRFIYQIPFALITENAILSSLGPRIPIKYTLVGEIETDCISSVTNYGINNALLTLNIAIKTRSRIIVPLNSKIVETYMTIPFFACRYEGEVPTFYSNGGNYNARFYF